MVRELRDWLVPYAEKIQVVCYLRRQVDMVVSFYSTRLKNGGTDSLESIALSMLRPDRHYCNYETVTIALGRCFLAGRNNRPGFRP